MSPLPLSDFLSPHHTPPQPSYGTVAPAPGGPGPGPAAEHPVPPEGLLLVPPDVLHAIHSGVWQAVEHMRNVSERVHKWPACDWHAVDRVILSATPQVDGYQLRGNPVPVLGRAPTRRLTAYNPTPAPIYVTDAAGGAPMLTVPPFSSVVMPWNADSVIVSCDALSLAGGDLAPILLVRSDRETDEIRFDSIADAELYNPATGLQEAQRTPTTFVQANAVGAGNSTVWTPAAGKRYRLLGFSIYAPSHVAAAVATLLGTNLKDSGGQVIFAGTTFVPAASVTTTPGTVLIVPPFDLPGNGFLSPAIGNALQLNLSAAINVGQIWISAWGTEE